MVKIIRLILGLVVVFLFVACGGSSSGGSSNDVTKITKKNISGKTFNIKDSNGKNYITTFNSDGTITGGGSKFSSDFMWKVSKTGELQTVYMLLGMALSAITHKQTGYEDGCYKVSSTETYSQWRGRYEICDNQYRSQNIDDENDDTPTDENDIVSDESYHEKEGDRFTYTSTLTYIYSNGRSSQVDLEDTTNYTKVDEIPSKYSYSNDIVAPYLLGTTKSNGEIIELEYISSLGKTIIDDDLDGYTSIDSKTTEIEEENDEISYIGEKFTFKKNETIFSSNSGEEIGYRTIDMECKIKSREKITILAGVFNTVKTTCNYSWTRSKRGKDYTVIGTKSIWTDIDNEIFVKRTIDSDITSNKFDTTILFSSITQLKDYDISKNKNNKAMKKNNLFKIDKNKILKNIQKEISSLEQFEVIE